MMRKRIKNRGLAKSNGERSAGTVRPERSGPFIAEGLFFIGVGLTIFLFLSFPFFPGQEHGSRFVFLITACLGPGTLLDNFWGSDLLPFSTTALVQTLLERFCLMLYACSCVTAMCATGSILLRSLRVLHKFSIGERLFLSSVTGLAIWTGGLAWLGLFGGANQSLLIRIVTGTLTLYGLACFVRFCRSEDSGPATAIPEPMNDIEGSPLFGRVGAFFLVTAIVIFAVVYLLGAMVPTCEYDMLEYHLQGAREFYESGQIAFARHNVYLNMPLGVEMLYLWGMNLTGDIFSGAMVGKVLVGSLALLTALGTGLLIHRLTGNRTYALLGVAAYLSFPMNYGVFANGLNDGVTGLTLIAILNLFCDTRLGRSVSSPLLLGLIAGLAVSCKYTGVVFVLIPLLVGGTIALLARRLDLTRGMFVLFFGGLFFAGGAWYLKNAFATGNPFYPLLYSLLGDTSGTWTAGKNLRWESAHFPHDFSLWTLGDKFLESGMTAIESSPLILITLLAGLFYFARTVARRNIADRKQFVCIALVTLYVLYYLAVWWGMTHRILRFCVPLLPVLALLLALFCHGFFRGSTSNRVWRTGWLLLIAFVYLIVVLPLFQTNYLLPYRVIREDTARYGYWSVQFRTHPEMRAQWLPEAQTLLLIGQAQAFSYDSPLLYSTCWDDSPLVPILADHVRYDETRSQVVEMIDPEAIRKNLLKRRIGWILFDENELARFLKAGNYGITDPAMNGRLFNLLCQYNIVEPCPPGKSVGQNTYGVQKVHVYRVVPPSD